MERNVIVKFEPSKRLSEIMGFPYYIERSFTVRELLSQHLISEDDIRQLEQGNEIEKSIPIVV